MRGNDKEAHNDYFNCKFKDSIKTVNVIEDSKTKNLKSLLEWSTRY